MNKTLEQKKGGLVLPCYGRPVAQLKCVRKEEEGGEWDLALYVMGSHLSNFHALKTGKVTARKLGCVRLPDHIMDFEFNFAEQFQHFWKGVAAICRPEKFGLPGMLEANLAIFKELMAAATCKEQKKKGRSFKMHMDFFDVSDKIKAW